MIRLTVMTIAVDWGVKPQTKPKNWAYDMSCMGLDVRKFVFGVSDQVIPKPVCSVTEISLNSEILFVTSFDDTFQRENNNDADQTALMCSLVCAFVLCKFSRIMAHYASSNGCCIGILLW